MKPIIADGNGTSLHVPRDQILGSLSDQAQSTLVLNELPESKSLQPSQALRPGPLRRRSQLAGFVSQVPSIGRVQRPISLREARRRSSQKNASKLSRRVRVKAVGILSAIWQKNRGILLVMIAQFFGALMNSTARLMEEGGKGMKPLQILNIRMTITVGLSMAYMWWAKVPDAPFGKWEVRPLLVARGIGGFFGVYGLYYSLLYLPVAEATVLTFLAPIVASFACSILLKEAFTRPDQIASLVSLLGVIFISHPVSLFQSNVPAEEYTSPPTNGTAAAAGPAMNVSTDPTSMQRLSAIGFAMVGVCGQATAYTTIRWIGKRAHPLITVNYFSIVCAIISTIALILLPNIHFKLPSSLYEWSLLFLLGFCGFSMQLLLTAGLAHEKSSRATNMVYSEMLFALGFDKLIWNTSPGFASIGGGGLILGSTIFVAMLKRGPEHKNDERERDENGRQEESVGLMDVREEDEEQETEEVLGGIGMVPMKNPRKEKEKKRREDRKREWVLQRLASA